MASRVTDVDDDEAEPGLPHGGRQAAALAPYAGRWVALSAPTEVLVAAETPQEVLGWLAQHGRRADYGMFRVPNDDEEALGGSLAEAVGID
jgi:hypothetical protein